MFVAMLGDEALDFGFSTLDNERALAERQNSSPLPEATTVLTFRIDDYNNWRSQRYGRSAVMFREDGAEVISELRTFTCIVNIMSKKLGCAFDATRFILANLQNNRYNNFVNENGRLLGIEQIGKIKNISDLENGSWTERINVEITMTHKEWLVIKDNTLFVKTPDNLADLADSVDIKINTKK